MPRHQNRANTELRPIEFIRHYTEHAAGSVLVSFGKTRVLVTASVDERVPRHLMGKDKEGHGWITAEYSMLPGATNTRSNRERFRLGGRTQEIQRLIGRCLRASVDLTSLGQRTITIDADVLQADAGTRVAAITGAYVAMMDAMYMIQEQEKIKNPESPLWPVPVISPVAAVSVAVKDGEVLLDPDYEEDSTADVDGNIIMNAEGEIIEIQISSEGKPYTQSELLSMLETAKSGIQELLAKQKAALQEESPVSV